MKNLIWILFIIPCSIIAQNKVGIGTTTPQGKLNIVENSTLTLPHLRITELGQDFARIKMENSIHPGAYWDIAGYADTTTANAKFNFFFKNNQNSGDRVTITGTGNVGIGNTAPDAQLDILGGDWNLDAGNPGDLRIGNTTYNFRLGVSLGGGGAGNVRMYSQGGSLMLGANNATHLAISTLGNVGIGNTNPSNRLSVIGHSTSTLPVLSVSSNYGSAADVIGIHSSSVPITGYGIGGYFKGGYKGIQVVGEGATAPFEVAGIETSATGSAGTRVGIRASATGGTTNWAGYFAQGNVYVTNELRIGADAQGGVPGYKVAVDGKIIAEELRIQLSADWPDYVFEPAYELLSLSDLEHCIKSNRHLPGIPSAIEVFEEGIQVGDMQRRMMEKIEELTLYIIQLNKENKVLEQRLAALEEKNK